MNSEIFEKRSVSSLSIDIQSVAGSASRLEGRSSAFAGLLGISRSVWSSLKSGGSIGDLGRFSGDRDQSRYFPSPRPPRRCDGGNHVALVLKNFSRDVNHGLRKKKGLPDPSPLVNTLKRAVAKPLSLRKYSLYVLPVNVPPGQWRRHCSKCFRHFP